MELELIELNMSVTISFPSYEFDFIFEGYKI